MSGHVFVDESKQRDYLLAAAVVMPSELGDGPSRTSDARDAGSTSPAHEEGKHPRRSAIIDVIASTGASATIYDAGRASRSELAARESCLWAVVADVAAAGHDLLVVEQDDSLLWWDQQRLIEITRAVGCRGTLRYEHRRAEHDLLLAVPDAIAWCWAKGGQWRDRVQPLVSEVRQV